MSKRLAVILRADHEIGTGHLMRVNSLLPVLIDAGFEPWLFTDSFDERLLNSSTLYRNLEKCRNFVELASKVNKASPLLSIFDHYFLNKDTETKVNGLKAVIDDLKRAHECNLLTDSCFFCRNEDYQSLVPNECILLTGEKYSLIRKEFIGLKHVLNKKPRVLINYGGSDPAHACVIALNSVLKGELEGSFDFTILSGAANSDHEKLKSMIANRPEFELIHSCSNMGLLYARCDLAMGAYGGSFKERMCASLPCLCTVIADNQKGAPYVMQKLQAGADISLTSLANPDAVKKELLTLYKKRAFYIANGLRAIDGNGIQRVTEALLKLSNI